MSILDTGTKGDHEDKLPKNHGKLDIGCEIMVDGMFGGVRQEIIFIYYSV